MSTGANGRRVANPPHFVLYVLPILGSGSFQLRGVVGSMKSCPTSSRLPRRHRATPTWSSQRDPPGPPYVRRDGPALATEAPLPRLPGSGLRVRHDSVRRVQMHEHLQRIGLAIAILNQATPRAPNWETHEGERAQGSGIRICEIAEQCRWAASMSFATPWRPMGFASVYTAKLCRHASDTQRSAPHSTSTQTPCPNRMNLLRTCWKQGWRNAL
jgi:hypothetical protein